MPEPTQARLSGRRRLVLGALTLALALPTAARPADSFYTTLLLDGQRAYQRGDFTAAARDLRIACFGLLDEPELLMQGLVELALAQASSGDSEGYLRTFKRLLEVEERFGVYQAASVPAALRQAFEDETANRVRLETLRATPAFVHLAQRASARAARDLSPAQRRQELEARLAAEPGNEDYRLQLAELELEQGRKKRAASHLDELLAADPQNSEARCLRGRVAADSRDCRRAIGDLPACGQPVDSILAVARLTCHARLEQWQQADDFLATLGAAVRADPAVGSLEQRVRRALQKRSAPVTPAIAGSEPTGSLPGSSSAAGAEPAGQPREAGAGNEPEPPIDAASPAEPTAALTLLERRLAETRELDQLAGLFDEARRLADEHPASRTAHFLAAKIAFRASRWNDVVDLLQRAGGPPADDGALLFYFAVALYETGRAQAAAGPMRRALDGVERTPFVESYARKILGAEAGAP